MTELHHKRMRRGGKIENICALDVFSLGATLFAMTHGIDRDGKGYGKWLPARHANGASNPMFTRALHDLSLTLRCPQEVINLIAQATARAPQDRPSVQRLMRQDLFGELLIGNVSPREEPVTTPYSYPGTQVQRVRAVNWDELLRDGGKAKKIPA